MKNRRFWASDYPLLCFPYMLENKARIDSFVMINVCDPHSGHMTINLKSKFISFVDTYIDSKDAQIAYLSYLDEEEDQIALTFIYYKDPFLKKKFNDKSYWTYKYLNFDCNNEVKMLLSQARKLFCIKAKS